MPALPQPSTVRPGGRAVSAAATPGPSSALMQQQALQLRSSTTPMVVALPLPPPEPRVFARLAAAVEMDVSWFFVCRRLERRR